MFNALSVNLDYNNAQEQLHQQSGGVLTIPDGTWSGNLQIRSSNLTIRGTSRYASILTASSGHIIQSSTSFPRRNLIIENLTFDCANVGSAINLAGYAVYNVTIRNCTFLNVSDRAIQLIDQIGFTVENCEFFSTSPNTGRFIVINSGSAHGRIVNNTFHYGLSQLQIDGGITPCHDIDVMNNSFIHGWWYLPIKSSGTGIYTSETLTDSGASFSADQYSTVRAILDSHTGAIASVQQSSLTDDTATFSTYSRGDIVRSGSKFSIVESVETDTKVIISGWRDELSFAPTDTPANGSSYTIQHIAISLIQSHTATELTVRRWQTFDGVTVTVPDNTPYEVSISEPVQPLLITEQCYRCNVIQNRASGQFADFATHGNDHIIALNHSSDAADNGIVANHGEGYIIALNRVTRAGSSGLAAFVDYAVVLGNMITDAPYRLWNESTDGALVAGLKLAGQHIEAAHNYIRTIVSPVTRWSIMLQDSIDVRLLYNKTIGWTLSRIRSEGTTSITEIGSDDGA